jgi:hypothetical protein
VSSPLEPFKVDYTSFYKFVASVGLILIASAAAIPWFVMRAAIPEALPDSDAAATLELAADTRAEQYLLALQAYPWVSLGLIITGLSLTLYGLVTWKSRQAKQDADDDESYRQRRELGRTTAATAAERQEKLDDETEPREAPPEASTKTDTPATRPSGSDPGGPEVETRPADSHQLEVAQARLSQRERLERYEARVGQLLSGGFLETHSVESGVRVSYPEIPSAASILDFVARAKNSDKWTSFAVEVRVTTARRLVTISDALRQNMLRVAIAAHGVPEGPVPNGSRGRPALANSVSLLVVIVSEPAEEEPSSSLVHRATRSLAKHVSTRVLELNSVLSRKVGVILLHERSLPTLEADDFNDIIISVLRDPERAFIEDLFDPLT